MVYTKADLTAQWLDVYSMADDEEMDFDSWYQMMMAIEEDIEVKAENTAKVIKNWEADADSIQKEADRLSARAKTLKNKAEWSKRGLQMMMEATGKTKFKTELFSFGIQKNGGKAPLIINEGVTTDDVPPEYVKWLDPVLDNTAIREALERGEELDFAKLGERGESLRIR